MKKTVNLKLLKRGEVVKQLRIKEYKKSQSSSKNFREHQTKSLMKQH